MYIFVHHHKPNDSYYAILHLAENVPQVIEIPEAKSWAHAERIMRERFPAAVLA